MSSATSPALPRLLRGVVASAVAVTAALSMGCAPKLIPNTTIRDTQDNRQILEVIRRYKNAFEALDAQAIAALASPRYLDARHNISYETLVTDLEKDFEHVRQVQLDIAVKRIDIEKDVARVDYIYSANILIRGTGEDRWEKTTDDKRMTLVRDGNEWKVLSGF